MLMSPHPLIVFAISPALVEADHLTLKSNSPFDDGTVMPNRFHRAFARMARTTSDIKTLSLLDKLHWRIVFDRCEALQLERENASTRAAVLQQCYQPSKMLQLADQKHS
jgi:hypothetical protein